MARFKPVKDDLRAPQSSHEEDGPILVLLNKGKTVFVTDFEEADFRRLYGKVRATDDNARLRRKQRTVDGEAGHVIWVEVV